MVQLFLPSKFHARLNRRSRTQDGWNAVQIRTDLLSEAVQANTIPGRLGKVSARMHFVPIRGHRLRQTPLCPLLVPRSIPSNLALGSADQFPLVLWFCS